MSDVLLVVVTGTILFVLLGIFITSLILIYQRRQHQYQEEMIQVKENYQQEILKARLEMKEQTLLTIAQEIHDNIGQVLSLVKLNLNTVPLENSPSAAEKITATKDLVGKAIQDLRNLSKTLNTDYILHQKLSDALRFELNLLQKTGLYTTDLQVHGPEKPIDPSKQLILFRIAQEIFNNIMKHADARHISVAMHYQSDGFTLRIDDDGVGFAASAVPGTGIRNMHHRAKLIGADFAIDSQPGKGTSIRLTLPTHSSNGHATH